MRCGPAGSNHFHHSSSAAGRAWQCGFFRDIRYQAGHLHKPPLSDPNWPGSSGRQPALDRYGSRAHWRAITVTVAETTMARSQVTSPYFPSCLRLTPQPHVRQSDFPYPHRGPSGRCRALDRNRGRSLHSGRITQPNLAISRHASPRGGFLFYV